MGQSQVSAMLIRKTKPRDRRTLALFYHFRQRIIWKAYNIRPSPKILISAILLENKRSNARSIYSSKFGSYFYFPRVTEGG